MLLQKDSQKHHQATKYLKKSWKLYQDERNIVVWKMTWIMLKITAILSKQTQMKLEKKIPWLLLFSRVQRLNLMDATGGWKVNATSMVSILLSKCLCSQSFQCCKQRQKILLRFSRYTDYRKVQKPEKHF